MREAGIMPQTYFILEGKINTAMAVAEYARTGVNSKISINPVVKEWKREIEIFDSLQMPGNRINAWIMGAGLVSIRRYGERALEFWEKYSNDQGVKTDQGRDGVEMLTRYVAQARAERQVGATWALTHAPKAIAAFDGYRKGYFFTVALKPKNIVNFLRG